jgi:hypothetical protein
MSYGATESNQEEIPLRQRYYNERDSTPLEEFADNNYESPSHPDQLDEAFAIGWQPLVPIWHEERDFTHWRKLIRKFLFSSISLIS